MRLVALSPSKTTPPLGNKLAGWASGPRGGGSILKSGWNGSCTRVFPTQGADGKTLS